MPVVGTGVPALAVHHHRAGQDQPADPRRVHGREQGSRAQVVVGGVRREVGHPCPRSHDGGLVADDVDPVEKAGPPVGIADVEPMGPVRGGPGTVRLRQHRVHAHDLGAVGVQRGADRAADEAGGTGQENLHGTRYVSSSPSAQAEQEHSPGSGRSAIALARSVPEAFDVAREHREHLLLTHPGPCLGTGVHVGHQGHRGVAHAQLPGQDGLGVPGHVDQRPALCGEVPGLGAGGEARALDHHHRAAEQHGVVGGGDGLGQLGAVRVGERHVHRTGLHEALDAAVGPVDELVGHDHVAGGDVGTKTADGAGGEDLADSQRAQRPEVGPVVDPVRRELVPGPVPRQERHPPPRDDAERDRRGGIAVRRLDPDRLRILEERVEATPADHGNVRTVRIARCAGHAASLSSAGGASQSHGPDVTDP